jgi:ribonuclease III family protein
MSEALTIPPLPFATGSLSETEAQRIAPAALAYIGDVVYELHVRLHYLSPPRRLQTYHRQVVAQVRAESQAAQLALIWDGLSEGEQNIARRGRNAATGRPRRLDLETYRQATAFEALVGYLYLTDGERLQGLLAVLALDQTDSQSQANSHDNAAGHS